MTKELVLEILQGLLIKIATRRDNIKEYDTGKCAVVKVNELTNFCRELSEIINDINCENYGLLHRRYPK